MGIYLECASPNEFSEINQYVSLQGICLKPENLMQEDLDTRKLMEDCIEYLMPNQQLLVPVMTDGFRSMLDEARKTHALFANAVLMIPATPQGMMAIKACKTLKVPAVLDRVDSVALAAFGAINQVPAIILEYGALSGQVPVAQIVAKLEERYPNTRFIVRGLSAVGQMEDLLLNTRADIMISYPLAANVFYHSSIARDLEDIQMNWASNFSRLEFIDFDTKPGE